MIKAFTAPALSSALKELKNIITASESDGRRTVIFCEDRLTLAAERTVCAAVNGTFLTSVYTFARFLSSECGAPENVLSSQGSAMAIRKLIDENREELKLFRTLSSTTAAQDVYDTIALLYSSRITADDLAAAETDNTLLKNKVADLALLYKKYSSYLQDNGCIDRNAYLTRLPQVIENSSKIIGADVIFLGFQSFTCSVTECARACMDAAKNVYGLFIGGEEDIYTNEALVSFSAAARSFGGCEHKRVASDLCDDGEHLRKNLFNPDCFHNAEVRKSGNIRIFEGADEEEEIEYIAANIIKHTRDEKIRYQAISVMLPDIKACESTLDRVFSEYGIPYYADRRYSLAEHPVCPFILNYLACAADGCTQDSTLAVISSPLFAANRKDKDIYVNYSLRLAAYRGGIKRQPDPAILESLKFDISAVERIRKPFLDGLELLPRKASGERYCRGVKRLLSMFSADKTLEKIADGYKDAYPALASLSSRAYESANAVLDEAERLTSGVVLTAREFSKILKSGFTAMEISLIPPKQDAVFVGDLATTANTGSEVVFAAGLTDAVPCATQDTAVLTDRELTSLEKINIKISPKIAQVNARSRELTALNLCAFRKYLYLIYPARKGGEECAASEVIPYIKRLFATPSGGEIIPLTARKLARSERAAAYYCSRPLPAARRLVSSDMRAETAAAVYAVLSKEGYKELADGALSESVRKGEISCGRRLYGDGVSPTALENYFSCPYKSFMRQGIKVSEREEGVMRPLDTGNFIHEILQKLAHDINGVSSETELRERARALAENLLLTPKYASLNASKRGKFTADSLIEEAENISAGMFSQLANSLFKVSAAEQRCEIVLDDGLKLFGRIDRVDGCGDMVRIVDYKTGNIERSAVSYYMGLKLQLPLYLLSASKGKRAVGAYYFPAKIEYADKADGVFRLKGFMDGSDEVVSSSDTNVKEKQKSDYVEAYYKGRKVEYAMEREEFADFLAYSALVARKGAREMTGGNVRPSPVENACKHCQFFGSCGFEVGTDGEPRGEVGVKCGDIAKVVRGERGGL